MLILSESEWADWSTASWSVCDASCGKGTKFRERKCKEIEGKRTCPLAETQGREEKQCTLGPCKGSSNWYTFYKYNFFPRMLLKGLHKSKRSSFESPVQLAGRLLWDDWLRDPKKRGMWWCWWVFPMLGFVTRQGGRSCASGARRKVLTQTEILSPNIRYFVTILRFVAIYAFYKAFIEL